MRCSKALHVRFQDVSRSRRLPRRRPRRRPAASGEYDGAEDVERGLPLATFLINVSGSFVMGMVVGYLAFKDGEFWTQTLRLFLTTGILGGYTTFSTFSLEFLLLVERGSWGQAFGYAAGSVLLAFAAVFAGMSLMRALA